MRATRLLWGRASCDAALTDPATQQQLGLHNNCMHRAAVTRGASESPPPRHDTGLHVRTGTRKVDCSGRQQRRRHDEASLGNAQDLTVEADVIREPQAQLELLHSQAGREEPDLRGRAGRRARALGGRPMSVRGPLAQPARGAAPFAPFVPPPPRGLHLPPS